MDKFIKLTEVLDNGRVYGYILINIKEIAMFETRYYVEGKEKEDWESDDTFIEGSTVYFTRALKDYVKTVRYVHETVDEIEQMINNKMNTL